MIAGNIFGTDKTHPIPENYYIGFSTTAPNIDGTGVSEPDPTTTGYARLKLTCLSEPDNGVVTNTQFLDFAESTGDWGTVTHFVIYDAQTGGNLLMYGELSNPKTVHADTVMTIKPEYLTLSVLEGGTA